MIGLDTNALVRLVVKDDAVQFSKLQNWLRRSQPNKKIYINALVLCESIWVLQSVYHYPKAEIVRYADSLLNNQDLILENETLVEDALRLYQNHSADFSDCLISLKNLEAGCNTTLTFDRAAAPLPTVKVL